MKTLMNDTTTDDPSLFDTTDIDPEGYYGQDTEEPGREIQAQETGRHLATIPSNLAEVFKPGGTNLFIQAVRDKAKEFEPDISTDRGRRALKSFCAQITHTKTFAEKAGRQFVAKQKENLKVWDAEIRKMCDNVDEIKEETRKPLTDWEQKEETRTAEHERALDAAMNLNHQWDVPPTAALIQERLVELETLVHRDWQEFELRASKTLAAVRHNLDTKLEAAIKAESERAELEKLRAEAAERKHREREDAIRAETEARVMRAAEESVRKMTEESERKARAEVEAAEAKAQADAEAAAKKARAAAERAERDRKAEEQLKKDAEARAARAEREKKDAIDAAEKARVEAEAKAKRDAEAAVLRERQRADAVAKQEAEQAEEERRVKARAEAARIADVKHRGLINEASITALMETVNVSSAVGIAIVQAIAQGKIPHVTINY